MAENLQQVKKRIKSSQSIAQITKAMEMIAASKIKKAQASVENNKAYAERISFIVQKILAESTDLLYNLPFLNIDKNIKRKLFYVISTDKGLCGGLLANIYKQILSSISKDDYIVTIGKKAQTFCIKNGYNVKASFLMGASFPKYNMIYPILKIMKDLLLDKKEISEVNVIYTNFKNRIVQQAITKSLVPIEKDKNFVNKGDHIFEPSANEVLKSLLPYYVGNIFYDMLMNAYASEQVARMSAMSNANENAKEIATSLTIIYNKSRQEKITNEILDLANGQIH